MYITEECRKLLIKHNYQIKIDRTRIKRRDGSYKKFIVNIRLPGTKDRSVEDVILKAEFDEFGENCKVTCNGKLEFASIKSYLVPILWQLPILDWCDKNAYAFSPMLWQMDEEKTQIVFPNSLEAISNFYSIINGCSLETFMGLKYKQDIEDIAKYSRHSKHLKAKLRGCLETRTLLPSEIRSRKAFMDSIPDGKNKEVGNDGTGGNAAPVSFAELEKNTDIQINPVQD